jgi:hypothetical protein
MVAVLGDQYLRHQRLGRHAAVDWTVGCRGLDDRIFAGATAVTRPADQPNPELSGNIIQHLSLVSPIWWSEPPQQAQALSWTSTMTSTRGKWAGKAPRLRFAGLPADGLVLALAAYEAKAKLNLLRGG